MDGQIHIWASAAVRKLLLAALAQLRSDLDVMARGLE